MTTCVVLGYYAYLKPFCIYSIGSTTYFCLDDLNALFFNNQLNSKAHYLKQLFKANPQHFSKSNDGRTFVMTFSVIQVARCFNYFYLAELCKLSVDEIVSRVGDPLLKCIDHHQWRMASPLYALDEHINLELEPLKGDESIFTCLSETETTTNEKQYVKPNGASRMSIEEQGKKQYRPITTTTIQLSTILHQWLSTDISEYQPGSSMFHTLKSVEKMKRQQQAIIETRQLQVVFTAPSKVTRQLNTDIKRKRGAPLQYNKKPKFLAVERKIFSHQEQNLHLLASQATQMRGLPISPTPSPPTPFLLQPIENQPKQPLRLPSIRAMLSELPIQVGNIDYCA